LQGLVDHPLGILGRGWILFNGPQHMGQRRLVIGSQGLQAHRQDRPPGLIPQGPQQGFGKAAGFGNGIPRQRQVLNAWIGQGGPPLLEVHQPGADSHPQGFIQGISGYAQRHSQGTRFQRLIRQRQGTGDGKAQGPDALQPARENLHHQVLVDLETAQASWGRCPALRPPLQGAIQLRAFENGPQQPGIAQAGVQQALPESLGKDMGTKEICDDMPQTRIFHAAQGHEGDHWVAFQGPQKFPQATGLPHGREGEKPGQPGFHRQGGQQSLQILLGSINIPHEQHAGVQARGEIEDLDGRLDFLGFHGCTAWGRLPSTPQEGKGFQSPGENPSRFRTTGIEIGLEPAQQILKQARQEIPGDLPMLHFIGGHPETFGFHRRGGPIGKRILAQALFPREYQHALHGRGRIEPEDQGFEIGQFLGAAADGAG